ncbi:MAG TPA: glycosyltransferase family A protein [Flavisolibacter sp.]|nr:glycosyltransferase family A protein [Flavisolibacter sp.]
MKVSILVPLYNCAPYLEACLESLINQTYKNIEILVSDDCSTDGSYEILCRIAETDKRIRVHRQAENIGLLKNYNFLFKKAKGELLAIQDSDDWSDLQRIEKQVSILQKHPDVVMTGVNAVFHYENGKSVSSSYKGGVINGIHDNIDFVPASIVFRRELLNEVNGMNPYFDGGTSMDRYFITEMLDGKKAYHINEGLYHARVRPSSNHRSFNLKKITSAFVYDYLLEQRRKTGTDWLKEKRWDMIEKLESDILGDRKRMSMKFREYATNQIDARALKPALPLLLKALRLNTFSLTNWRTIVYFIRSAKARKK